MVFLFNTDGVVNTVSGLSTAGGVLWDGNWILGYNCFLGMCSIVDAKLWDILNGLHILQKQKYDEVIILYDSLEVVIAISDFKPKRTNSSSIRRIQQLLANEEKWSLRYVPKENNKIADIVTKMTLLNDETLYMFDEPGWRFKKS